MSESQGLNLGHKKSRSVCCDLNQPNLKIFNKRAAVSIAICGFLTSTGFGGSLPKVLTGLFVTRFCAADSIN